MLDSGQRYIASAGETFDFVALNVYGNERYAAELLNANPSVCEKMEFVGGEELILPVVEVTDPTEPIYTPANAPWKG